MTDRVELPSFRYHPDPVASAVFVRVDAPCPCCGEFCGWGYEGPRYSLQEVEHICPWCIASGRAHETFDMSFGEQDALEPGASAAAVDELLHRTPWHFVAQREPWPVHCGDFCAVVGRLRPSELSALRRELEADIGIVADRFGLEVADVLADLECEHSPLWAYLFRCLSCGRRRLNADYE